MLYSHAGIFSEMAKASPTKIISLGVTTISMVTSLKVDFKSCLRPLTHLRNFYLNET